MNPQEDAQAFELWSSILSRLAAIEVKLDAIGSLESRVAQLERDRSKAVGWAIGVSAAIGGLMWGVTMIRGLI